MIRRLVFLSFFLAALYSYACDLISGGWFFDGNCYDDYQSACMRAKTDYNITQDVTFTADSTIAHCKTVGYKWCFLSNTNSCVVASGQAMACSRLVQLHYPSDTTTYPCGTATYSSVGPIVDGTNLYCRIGSVKPNCTGPDNSVLDGTTNGLADRQVDWWNPPVEVTFAEADFVPPWSDSGSCSGVSGKSVSVPSAAGSQLDSEFCVGGVSGGARTCSLKSTGEQFCAGSSCYSQYAYSGEECKPLGAAPAPTNDLIDGQGVPDESVEVYSTAAGDSVKVSSEAVRTGKNCGEFNGQQVCVDDFPSGSGCVQAGPGVVCYGATSSVPDTGVSGVSATPDYTLDVTSQTSGDSLTYYSSVTVNSSTNYNAGNSDTGGQDNTSDGSTDGGTGNCDPTKENCGAGSTPAGSPGIPDFYHRSDKTWTSVLTAFRGKVLTGTGAVAKATRFFTVSFNLSGGCPVWQADVMGAHLVIDQQCSPTMDTVWPIVQAVLAAVASFVAFRWAFL